MISPLQHGRLTSTAEEKDNLKSVLNIFLQNVARLCSAAKAVESVQ